MDFTRDHCFQELVRELSEKYRKRDEEVMALLHCRQGEKLKSRAEQMKRLLTGCLTDPDLTRCGLDARMTSVVRCNGYRIENVIIHTLEGCWLPVNVYVPDNGESVHPAILVCMGHWPEGKQIRENQILCANLAKNGFLTAVFDPICQGERVMFTPEELLSHFGPITVDMWSVNMHMIPGNLAYLLGKDIAAFFAWEGIRVIDYLFTREDIDKTRVGVTGQSGGGTQCMYVAVLDERVGFFSPIQCISKQALVLEKSGIGDCEQSITGISREIGFDYPDMLWAAFPKPVMVSSGRDDFFFLPGVRQVEAELTLLYERAGGADDYEHNIAPCAHEISPWTRQFAVDWFTKKMQGCAAEKEADIPVQKADVLRCYPEGLNTKTAIDIYADMAKAYAAKRPKTKAELLVALKKLVPVAHDSYTVEPLYSADGFIQYLLHTVSNRTAVCRLYKKESDTLTAVIAPDSYDLSPIINLNTSVLVITPWAMQTTYSKKRSGYDDETCLFNASAVLGQNIMVNRVNEVVAVLDYALEVTGCNYVNMLGAEAGSMVALITACMDRRVNKTVLLECQTSFDDMFGKEMYFINETSIVPGMIRITDIPGLAAVAGNVTFVNPRDFNNEPVAGDDRVNCICSHKSVNEAAKIFSGR